MPPAGFRIVDLPEEEVRDLGPAVLRSSFTAGPDGRIDIELNFDTVQRHFSAAEAEALIQGVRDIYEGPQWRLRFEQIGEAHLAAGRVREALEEFRALAEAQPEAALPRTRIARALLAAGQGGAARQEARRAVEMEPENDIAHQTLGIVLQHDSIGRPLDLDWDREGSIAAFRRAKELAPSNPIHRQNLALVLERGADGQRYVDAQLEEAIVEYRELWDDLVYEDVAPLLLVALVRAERFEEAIEFGREAGYETHPAVLAAVTALHGSSRALRQAGRLSAGERRSQLLGQTVDLLKCLRRYPEAAEMLRAAAQGSRNATQVLSRTSLLEKAIPIEQVEIEEGSPKALLREVLIAEAVGRPLKHLYSTVVGPLAGVESDLILRATWRSRMTLRLAELPWRTAADLSWAMAEVRIEGDDTEGYVLDLGPDESPIFVVHEADGYLLLSRQGNPAAVGLHVLHLLDNAAAPNHEATEQMALKWLRRGWEHLAQSKSGEVPSPAFEALLTDDTLFSDEGSLPRELLRAGVSALLASSSHTADQALRLLDEIAEAPAGIDADLYTRHWWSARLQALENSGAPTREALELTLHLKRAYPDDSALLWKQIGIHQELGESAMSRQLIDEQLEADPNDPTAINALALWYQSEERIEESCALLRQLVDDGDAWGYHLNELAWRSLYLDTVDEEAVGFAQQAVQFYQQNDYASLHTLATVLAAGGRAPEAREILLHAMTVNGFAEPQSADWFVLALIAQQYGLRDEAIDLFRKVTPSETDSPLSTHALAQKRLQSLEAETAQP